MEPIESYTTPHVAKRELHRVGLKYDLEDIPKISVVIPAYNEDRRLARTLVETWNFLDSYSPSYEIIVVDDGSIDATALLVRQFHRLNPRIILIRLGRNRGKGAAVRLGMNNARGRYIIYLDADGSSRIDHMAKLVCAVDDGADVAIGSRITRGNDETKVTRLWHRHLIGQTFNFFVQRIAVPGFLDTQCGFKMFRQQVARVLFSKQKIEGFAFDVEVLYLCRRLGFRVVEIPIDWSHAPGSKLWLLRDSLYMLFDLCRIRLLHMFSMRQDGAQGESINQKIYADPDSSCDRVP